MPFLKINVLQLAQNHQLILKNINGHNYFENYVEEENSVEVLSTLLIGVDGRVRIDEIIQIMHQKLNLILYLNHMKATEITINLLQCIWLNPFNLKPCVNFLINFNFTRTASFLFTPVSV